MSKAKFPNTTRRRLSSVVIINSSNKNKVDNNIRNNDKTIRAIRIVMIAMIMIMITLVVIIMRISCSSNYCFGPRVIFGPRVLAVALTRTCPVMIIGSNAGLLWFAKFSDGERPQGGHCQGSGEMRRQGQQSQRTSRGSWE